MNDNEAPEATAVAEEEARQAEAKAERVEVFAGWTKVLTGEAPVDDAIIDTLADEEARDTLVARTVAMAKQLHEADDLDKDYAAALGEMDMSEEARRTRVAVMGSLINAYEGPARQDLLCVYALMVTDVESGDHEDYKDALKESGSFALPILMASAGIDSTHTLTNLLAGLCTSRVGVA